MYWYQINVYLQIHTYLNRHYTSEKDIHFIIAQTHVVFVDIPIMYNTCIQWA